MEKNERFSNSKKGVFIFLIVLMIILLILSIILYFNEVDRILPIIVFLVLPLVVSFIILLLSKNIWTNYISKKRDVVSRKVA